MVEDDLDTRLTLELMLRSEGFDVVAVGGVHDAEQVVSMRIPSLALIDIRLGDDHEGLAFARSLRDRSDTAVIVVSGAADLDDRLAGFAAGCDDYVAKPFEPAELMARVHAVLRRRVDWSTRRWEIGDLIVDEAAHSVRRGGTELKLTLLEYSLLCALGRRHGNVVSKKQLLRDVWEYEDYDTNVVEVHISGLRRKLETHGPRLIHTVRGVGYVLRS